MAELPFRAIKIVYGDDTFLQTHFSQDDILRLRGQLIYSPTTIFVLPAEDMEHLAIACAGAIHDRGRKLPAKPLTYYLANRTGMVLIRTDYRSPGQAERGLRALLQSSNIHTRGTVCFLTVASPLFDDLWNRARSDVLDQETFPLDSAQGRDHLSHLLSQNPRLQVPARLEKDYVGNSPLADGVRKRILLAAGSDCPVLIEGESGTGKEVVAQQIHFISPRRLRPFVTLNCGAIPAELFESILFGHVKGSFTGALFDNIGHWKQADHGTLFLDEIGDLSSAGQVKVLRALENKKFYPVGGKELVESDARIIAATNRNLQQMVAAGKFREDLYYRLFTLRIRTPALREHPSVIPDLAKHLWDKLNPGTHTALSDEVLNELKRFPWFGNVRELRSFLTSVFLITDGQPVTRPLIHAVMRDRMGTANAIEDDQ
jgi:DNA-binding NtrC family response regulator